MNTCANCGQINTAESHFCRFCGTKFTHAAPPPYPATAEPFGHAAPPRPYSWKTDEFQTKQEARRTNAFAAPLSAPMPSAGQPLVQQPPLYPAQSYRCPHCMSQFLPRIERRISTAGWITFAALLVFFFPLFWIGLLIKEDVRICPTCIGRVG
ncbi:MAG: LITAF-like zinc ribbon domain-containing protein [Chloracidobacterium sp.]|nr:LITAF-like zinc ribbon domain-containing protein [Chloracidobacterium sp.]